MKDNIEIIIEGSEEDLTKIKEFTKISKKDIKNAPHHGNTYLRVKPVDVGTDYFSFECPECDSGMLMAPYRLRQCKGYEDDGRLIINLCCVNSECGFKATRKLWLINDLVKCRLEVCNHE